MHTSFVYKEPFLRNPYTSIINAGFGLNVWNWNLLKYALSFPMVHNAYQSDLQLSVQSVPITTYIVSSILDQGEMYNIMW
jgi:hypothetical protein